MRLIDADTLIDTLYDHEFASYIDKGEVSTVINDEPTVDAVPTQYILTTIRKWNHDGYAESAEALEILVMNWDKENAEWAERKEE